MEEVGQVQETLLATVEDTKQLHAVEIGHRGEELAETLNFL